MSLFKTRDQQAFRDSLSQFYPGDKLNRAKDVPNKRYYELLQGLAGEFFTANGYVKTYADEIIPDQTVLFIPEWESAVGIPDDCFTGAGSNDNRRRDILVKLAASGVQTPEDFVALAALFGIDAEVFSGTDFFSGNAILPMTLPFTFGGVDMESFRYQIVVVFDADDPGGYPYTFPILFGDDAVGLLKCVFEKLKPSNCQLIFIEE